MAKLVSTTYGDALFEVAMEGNQLDNYMDEAKGIIRVLKENEELTRLMTHPKVVKEEKVKMMENIFGSQVSREVLGLMNLIITKGHFGDMEAVLQYYVDKVKEYKNIGTAYVTSAFPLSEAQQEQIKAKLLATTKYIEFDMYYEVDKKLIGGMVIRIGDRVMDSSVKTKIYNLSKELSKIQLKAGECTP